MLMDQHAWLDRTTPLQSALSMGLTAMMVECEQIIIFLISRFKDNRRGTQMLCRKAVMALYCSLQTKLSRSIYLGNQQLHSYGRYLYMLVLLP